MKYFFQFPVILSITTPEVEGRRLILRGRRTITRHYYRKSYLSNSNNQYLTKLISFTGGLAIPAWAIIVLCAIANLLIGVILYFVMRKVVLSGPVGTSNSYAPAMVDDV